jgi:hypothetical protein
MLKTGYGIIYNFYNVAKGVEDGTLAKEIETALKDFAADTWVVVCLGRYQAMNLSRFKLKVNSWGTRVSEKDKESLERLLRRLGFVLLARANNHHYANNVPLALFGRKGTGRANVAKLGGASSCAIAIPEKGSYYGEYWSIYRAGPKYVPTREDVKNYGYWRFMPGRIIMPLSVFYPTGLIIELGKELVIRLPTKDDNV